jgi:hypothetical protein
LALVGCFPLVDFASSRVTSRDLHIALYAVALPRRKRTRLTTMQHYVVKRAPRGVARTARSPLNYPQHPAPQRISAPGAHGHAITPARRKTMDVSRAHEPHATQRVSSSSRTTRKTKTA